MQGLAKASAVTYYKTMDDLRQKKCKPCEGGMPALTPGEVEVLRAQVPEWNTDSTSTTLARTFDFANFRKAIDFIHRVADVAEAEGHHPDIFLHGYKHVTISLTTHALSGLSENDFIEAAKIEAIAG